MMMMADGSDDEMMDYMSTLCHEICIQNLMTFTVAAFHGTCLLAAVYLLLFWALVF